MAIPTARQISVIMVAALLAMLWIFPAVWCFERDGSIRIKTASPCTEASSHCPGERDDAAGPDCTDVSIYSDGLTRSDQRVAGGGETFPLPIPSVVARSFLLGAAPNVSNLAYKDRTASAAGPDPTIVLTI